MDALTLQSNESVMNEIGGKYHGKLIFPASYPFKPPTIMMCTPSGRFKTNTRLCLSMSDFHPETWLVYHASAMPASCLSVN
jgi:ubiquitin-protein ligase